MNLHRLFLIAVIAAVSVDTISAQHAPRPNIVVVLMDDVRWDELGCTGHPFAKTPNIDRLAREGARFLNAFAVTPLCSPSRASFLTGLYPHAHGITDNTDRSAASHKLATFPQLFQKAGYDTAFIGKWHMGVDDSPRPGFTHWVGLAGQGAYIDPELNVDGKREKTHGYVTDILTDRAVDFINRPHDKPFLLYLAHKAVHPDTAQRPDGSLTDPSASKFLPASRHKDLYTGAEVPRRPNVKDTLKGKPALTRPIEGLPPLGPATGTSDEVIRDRQRVLASADEGLGRMLDALAKLNRLDNTVVVFTSDHGYYYGEHGLSVERRLAYDEGIRIPLLVRYPRLVKAGIKPVNVALSLDLAPTLLDLAGIPAPPGLHGQSLVPVLTGSAPITQRPFLIEHSSDDVFPRTKKMGYRAVRTSRWKYIRYTDLKGMDELYDLQADPYEMTNLAGEPARRDTIMKLQAEMERLRQAAK